MSFIDRQFALGKRNSIARIEIVGGITSFLAAAYLLVVIPPLLATGIAGGLLVYVLVKAPAGRFRDIPIGLVVLAIPPGYYFWTAVDGKH